VHDSWPLGDTSSPQPLLSQGLLEIAQACSTQQVLPARSMCVSAERACTAQTATSMALTANVQRQRWSRVRLACWCWSPSLCRCCLTCGRSNLCKTVGTVHSPAPANQHIDQLPAVPHAKSAPTHTVPQMWNHGEHHLLAALLRRQQIIHPHRTSRSLLDLPVITLSMALPDSPRQAKDCILLQAGDDAGTNRTHLSPNAVHEGVDVLHGAEQLGHLVAGRPLLPQTCGTSSADSIAVLAQSALTVTA